MLNCGRAHLLDAPHLTIFPGLAIALLVLGFNFLGDGLRDALDPVTQRRASAFRARYALTVRCRTLWASSTDGTAHRPSRASAGHVARVPGSARATCARGPDAPGDRRHPPGTGRPIGSTGNVAVRFLQRPFRRRDVIASSWARPSQQQAARSIRCRARGRSAAPSRPSGAAHGIAARASARSSQMRAERHVDLRGARDSARRRGPG